MTEQELIDWIRRLDQRQQQILKELKSNREQMAEVLRAVEAATAAIDRSDAEHLAASSPKGGN